MAKEMKVKLTFVDELLGTASADPEVHREYIASRAPEAPGRAKKITEEIEAIGLEDTQEKHITVFPRDKNGNPIVWDYQIKGFFKNAAKALAYMGGEYKLTAYKTKIDLLVFINERMIPIDIKGEIGDCQRPLRASTMQGDRVALANSESIPAGSSITFIFHVNENGLIKHVENWLDFGKRNGLGQWRNSGKGSFTWEKLEDWHEVKGF